jgi:hypothetical protein
MSEVNSNITGNISVVLPAKDSALKLMRKPFEPHQISKMCKSTKKDNQPGRCRDCGGFHKLPSVQLSYVGHAAITDRLLEADPQWSWEPLSFAADGTPFLDANGGMWIKLTVAGVTRLGYGDAQGKTGGDAMKERIGDALRNAAMRFGAALDLWHKGDLHGPEEEESEKFEKQAGGSFTKVMPEKTSALNNGQAAAQPSKPDPTPVSVQKPKPAAKPAAKKKAEPEDHHLPWSGQFEPKPENKATSFNFGNNTVTPENPITDNDLPENLQPKPEDNRLATEAERKVFVERAKALKAKGFEGIGPYLLRAGKVTTTQDIPFVQMNRMFDELEAAEKNGKLKELLTQ